jgi:hypothetical protein
MTIARSTQLSVAIVGIEETAVSNPRSRKRRGLFDVLMTRRSAVRFTASWGMIWKSVKLS